MTEYVDKRIAIFFTADVERLLRIHMPVFVFQPNRNEGLLCVTENLEWLGSGT